jgi:hypothetical protein
VSEWFGRAKAIGAAKWVRCKNIKETILILKIVLKKTKSKKKSRRATGGV